MLVVAERRALRRSLSPLRILSLSLAVRAKDASSAASREAIAALPSVESRESSLLRRPMSRYVPGARNLINFG